MWNALAMAVIDVWGLLALFILLAFAYHTFREEEKDAPEEEMETNGKVRVPDAPNMALLDADHAVRIRVATGARSHSRGDTVG